jgi:4-hydroxybenzoate polyprenyltransferase
MVTSPNIMVVAKEEKRPLVVDLDGTLLQSDSLLESVCAVIRRRFFDLFALPIWLSRGLPYFKQRVYARNDSDVSRLPYNLDILEALRIEQKRGRKLILATGAHEDFALKVADHLGIFSETFGSNASTNLTGTTKANRLLERYGVKGFDYAGNSRVDKAVWRHASTAWLVSDSESFSREVKQIIPVAKEFRFGPPRIKVYAKALRVHQWAKNLLIFLPTMLSHRYFDTFNWILCLLAFASFSFIASSVYLLNDLLDIEADRQHPDNKKRPFAAGTLSIASGWSLAPLLLSFGLGIGLYISVAYFWVVLGYFAMTCLYSVKLKQVALADIVALAVLYTWRVLAGGVATETIISEWFLTFALFFFLSLALLKRCSELILLEQNQEKKNKRRGYVVSDLPLLLSFGVASSYLSVLVLALYLNDSRVAVQLRYPEALWTLCPILLFWLSRLWLMAYRGKMTTDPLVFALRDRTSYIIALAAGSLWLLARGPQFLAFAF